MTDSRSGCVVEISTETRPIVYPTIDWLSTDCRLTIDRLSTAISTTLSADRSVDTTYSKQGKKNSKVLNALYLWNPGCPAYDFHAKAEIL